MNTPLPPATAAGIPEPIIALDVPSCTAAQTVLRILPPEVRWVKIGLELFTAEGPRAVHMFSDAGKSIFLDLKFHDIPRTVERAVTSASRLGVSMLTVHATGGSAMLRAATAAAAASTPKPRIVAVTMLTSLDSRDLADIGFNRTPQEQAIALAELALSSGIDGLVVSPLEIASIRARFGQTPILVVPGIRPTGAETGDQKRVATAASAVRDGATFLVVGRPVLEASDPRDAFMTLQAEIRRAWAAARES